MSYYPPQGQGYAAPPAYGGYTQTPDASNPAGPGGRFQMPAGINFNAPVIRMGLPQQGRDAARPTDGRFGGDMSRDNRSRMGLGADSGRSSARDMQPMTREEVARTVYVAGLVDGTPDDTVLEEILGVGRGLRKWTRAGDAAGKLLDFGFAEYDDAASLDVAVKILADLKLPLKKDGEHVKDDQGNIALADIKIVVDPASQKYIDQWAKPDGDSYQFRLDTATDDLQNIINTIKADRPLDAINPVGDPISQMGFPDAMGFPVQGDGAEIVALPATGVDDDLSDIPADKRAMIAAEIAAFRNRSTLRDVERLKKEQEMEKAERERSSAARFSGPAFKRLATPPFQPPKGPASRSYATGEVSTASQPYHGAQIPKDYVDGVTFVQAGNIDDDSSASDTELERRRREDVDEKLEKRFLEQERRWIQKEKVHFAALERQQRDEATLAAASLERTKELTKSLAAFDDDEELRKPTHMFYRNRRKWQRERHLFRREERRHDDYDRRDEERETGRDTRSERRHHDVRNKPEHDHDRIKSDYDYDRNKSEYDHDRDRRRHRSPSEHHHRDRSDRAREEPRSAQRERQPRPTRPGGPDFNFALGEGESARPDSRRDPYPRGHNGNDAQMPDLNASDDGSVRSHGRGEREDRHRTKSLNPESRAANGGAGGAGGTGAAGLSSDRDDRRKTLRGHADALSKPDVIGAQIPWHVLSPRVIADFVRPVVQAKIYEALGVQEDILVSDVDEVVRSHGTYAQVLEKLEILEEDAVDVAVAIWREVGFVAACAEKDVL